MMDIEKLARAAGMDEWDIDTYGDSRSGATLPALRRFAALVAEEAAKVCESLADRKDADFKRGHCPEDGWMGDACAENIRKHFKA
jgi:hypothetical protein